MFCLLDVIAWPIFLIGGSVIFLIAAGILLCVSAVVLMLVAWRQHRKKAKKSQTTEGSHDIEES